MVERSRPSVEQNLDIIVLKVLFVDAFMITSLIYPVLRSVPNSSERGF
jgi:hypothetical protein